MSSRPKADVIFFGGPVVTMAKATAAAEAVAIADGRILAVGDRGAVMKHRATGTRLVDLAGRALLPGFHNAHVHPVLAAVAAGWENLGDADATTPEGVWRALEQAVGKYAPGEWVFVYGWDPILVEGLDAPTLARLDEIAPDNPLFITPQGGHQAYLNSRALAAAGISRDTPDPGHGSWYERDQAGALTGRLVEQPAFFPVQQKFGMPQTPKAWRQALRQVFRSYARMGLTSVTAMGIMVPTPEVLEIYRNFTAAEPGIRHNVFLTWYARDQLAELSPGDGHPYFRIKGLKIWYDGSPYSGSMLLEQPYEDNAYTRDALGIASGERGHANWTAEGLRAAMQKAHQAGWQIAVHTQGDRALRESLQVLEGVAGSEGADDRRHRFEHLMLAEPELFGRIAKAGFGTSFHIQHIPYYGRVLRDQILGAERTRRLLPIGSAMRAGASASLHSDHPMFSSTPMAMIQTAVTRRSKEGERIAGDQAISVQDALRAMTQTPAWQVHEEANTGSIEVGKFADFVVLSENPLEVPTAALHSIQVEETWVGGAMLWDRSKENNR